MATEQLLPFRVDGVAYTSPAVLDPSPAQATLVVDQYSAQIGDTCYVFQDWYDVTHDQVMSSGYAGMSAVVRPRPGTAYLGRYTQADAFWCWF